jgi:Kef-type K+ transport system membrane component KefB
MLSFMSNLPAAPAFTSILSTPQPILAAVGAENAPILLTGVLLSLIIIYLASKIGAEISQYLKFPPVLGELVGGVVVGVSALHAIVFADSGVPDDAGVMVVLQWIYQLSPTVAATVFESQSEVISVLAELGVIILLFEIGLESDLRQFRQVGIQAVVVACVGVVVPFAAGTVGLMAIFHVAAIPAIFAGAALTATSIGITSKVLAEIGQLKSTEGQIIVGAAVIDDVLGIIVLAVVASLAKTGKVDVSNVLYLIISATVFLVGAVLLSGLFDRGFVAIVESLKTRIYPGFFHGFSQ